MDNTTIHPASNYQIQHVDLHLWRGAPKNLDENRPIEILVNHGYIVGFCPDRLQPAWSAYRVAHAKDDVNYDRPHVYYDDMRLGSEYRIGPKTFGKIGVTQLHVGHMAPNEVINRQFGRLAQMETFFMSNMSPQYGTLNVGVWLKLENAIREIEDTNKKDHVWVIVGPIFGDEPSYISRSKNKKIPVPESYFCITVDPHSYPWKYPSNVTIDCYIIPQEAPSGSSPLDYPATLEEIQALTKLEFFAKWGREFSQEMIAQKSTPLKSRLRIILEKNKAEVEKEKLPNNYKVKAKSLQELIDGLKTEAISIREDNDQLSQEQLSRINTLQHSISCLLKAQALSNKKEKKNDKVKTGEVEVKPSNFITYKIENDYGEKLKKGVRIACNFWNRFIQPKYSIVIRLGIFTGNNNTIARAYRPYEKGRVRYGKVEFNTKFLNQYSNYEIAGTIIHEIGHCLGFGWGEWETLFDHDSGKFKPEIITKLNELIEMEVELDGGHGTARSHWDEKKFKNELMTGYKNKAEIILPVTINIMSILGHEVIERLSITKILDDLLMEVEGTLFSRQNEIVELDLDYYQETELLEIIESL